MLQHRIARTEELLTRWRKALSRYELQLLEKPDDLLYRGQVGQTKDLLRELTQDLLELQAEQAQLATQPDELLHS